MELIRRDECFQITIFTFILILFFALLRCVRILLLYIFIKMNVDWFTFYLFICEMEIEVHNESSGCRLWLKAEFDYFVIFNILIKVLKYIIFIMGERLKRLFIFLFIQAL